MYKAFLILQILIGTAIVVFAKSDIQLIPGALMIFNAINFLALTKK